jgi:hypothetical protein
MIMAIYKVILIAAIFLFSSFHAVGGQAPFELLIEKVYNQLQGHYAYISISANRGEKPIDKFLLTVAYDTTILSFVNVRAGDFLEKCGGWTMNYQTTTIPAQNGDSLEGLIRISAFYDGESNNQDDSCFVVNKGEDLVSIKFYVKNDRYFECALTPIRFYWESCRDNMIYSPNEDVAFVSKNVIDFDNLDITKDTSFPTYNGAPSECISAIYPGRVVAERGVDFANGSIEIMCSDSIDCRWDFNQNGISDEIGDAIAILNYFLLGYPFSDDPDRSFEVMCYDINGDGIHGTIEDYVCYIRHIVNNFPDTALEGRLTLRNDSDRVGIYTQCEKPIGGLWLKFRTQDLDINPLLEPSLLNIKLYHNWRNDTLTILAIHDLFAQQTLTEIMTIQYTSQRPELIFASAAGYYGEKINLTIQDILPVEESRNEDALPENYILFQNYPNPFNSSTEIKFSLPVKSDWNLEIFDVSGRRVKRFSRKNNVGEVGIIWNGIDETGQTVSSGVYFYRLEADGFRITKKMTLLK